MFANYSLEKPQYIDYTLDINFGPQSRPSPPGPLSCPPPPLLLLPLLAPSSPKEGPLKVGPFQNRPSGLRTISSHGFWKRETGTEGRDDKKSKIATYLLTIRVILIFR